MLNKFNSFIAEQKLLSPNDKVLLAVSGGIDSLVMTHLFLEANYQVALAHCNFQLRGKESDDDQQFIEEFAKNNNLQIHVKKFDTDTYCKELSVSTQMGARDLRYNWFGQLINEHAYSLVAIAHNRNDVAETMLINLIRGTGLKGITGIKAKNKDIIRPLLFASRKEIEQYASEHEIHFREDSSNAETKYHRNLIRHTIIPEMEKLNPSIVDTLNQEASVFEKTYQVYSAELKKWWEAIAVKENNQLKISIQKLMSLRIEAEQFYDLISRFGFTLSDSADILQSLKAEPGKQFHSEKYILLKDRDYLILESRSRGEEKKHFRIPAEMEFITNPIPLSFQKIKQSTDFKIPDPKKAIALDYDKLEYPLDLRHWQEGDYFIPLGMTGRKKLSDYFIDQKINLLDKKKIWLLLSNDTIVAVLGYQIDDRFKITSDTNTILVIKYN